MKQTIYLKSDAPLKEMLEMRYFCANVTHLRTVEKLTKQRLAEVTGLSISTISQIENDKMTNKQIAVVLTLAALFRVPVQALLWTDLSYLPSVKDRFAMEYQQQLGPKFSHSAISNFNSYRQEQLASGAYNRDLNQPNAKSE